MTYNEPFSEFVSDINSLSEDEKEHTRYWARINISSSEIPTYLVERISTSINQNLVTLQKGKKNLPENAQADKEPITFHSKKTQTVTVNPLSCDDRAGKTQSWFIHCSCYMLHPYSDSLIPFMIFWFHHHFCQQLMKLYAVTVSCIQLLSAVCSYCELYALTVSCMQLLSAVYSYCQLYSVTVRCMQLLSAVCS